MRAFLIYASLLVLAFVQAGCTPATPVAAEEDTVEQIYTSVAAAFLTEAAKSTQAYTPAVTSTLTPRASATPAPSTTPTSAIKASSTAAYSSAACDNSAYVSDVTIPDGTVLAPGESFTKIWNFQNTGTCAWTTSYSIAYASGNALSGSTTPLTSAVSSGGTLNVAVAMVAPAATGSYTGYWRLQNASGVSFGQSVYVQIVVSDGAATITPTPTVTEAGSAYTATSTTAPTETPMPTATPGAPATETPAS